MLRGGSLFYALAIAVIIALVSSSLLLAAHLNRLSIGRDGAREEVLRNAYSGLEWLMDVSPSASPDEPVEMDLFGRQMDSVRLQRKSWGAFEIAVASAHRRGFSQQLVAAVGWQSPANDRTALILADLDRPLSIIGETRLRGDCFLPASGVQRAYIEGQSYSGDQLVYGAQKHSDRFLPSYNDTLAERLQALFDFRPGPADSILPNEAFSTMDSIRNSFCNHTLFIWSEGPIRINTQHISGQVCLLSRTAIFVGKNSSLENALLIAPAIRIEKNTQGRFQAFARDSLDVEENVLLHYPSVLGLIGTNRSPDQAWLRLGEGSMVLGQLFACSRSDNPMKRVLLALDKKTAVYGSVYSYGDIDLKGTVWGDVLCLKFVLQTNSAVYENHLLGAVIDRTRRSPVFASSALTRKAGDHKTVVEWLE